ncbi:MAG: hypothetical protein QOF61_2781 [Acidobacteriota bacterium]|nr:hypothetical protein [Acidobacteriota bacterium]
MPRILVALILSVTFHASVCCQAQTSCGDFQRMIKATYNFKPSSLSAAEQSVKSEAMDRVWNSVKANPAELLPCLRKSLEDPNANLWFRFDGSNLLVSLDPSPAAKALLVRNYAAADLDDVDLRVWVTTLARLGMEGVDTSEAGARWLSYPKGRYFLPEHGAYEVKNFEAALYIYGSMDEAQATPALLRIVNQPTHPGRAYALALLTSQATTESLRALRELDAASIHPKLQAEVRTFLDKPKLIEPRVKPKTSRAEFLKAFERLCQRRFESVHGVSCESARRRKRCGGGVEAGRYTAGQTSQAALHRQRQPARRRIL